MADISAQPDLLFEVSWEVCNKVGGIYTVLSSKAKTLVSSLKDNVIFIGPDIWTSDRPSPYFIEDRRLLRAWASHALLPAGVDIRVGRWDIPGRPVAILVRFDGMYATKNTDYGRMWELYKVDSLHAYGDYDEGCAFARAAAAVIASVFDYFCAKRAKTGRPYNVVAHFDEWTTAMGLLTIKDIRPQIATVFTTHATCIGRSIAGNGKPLYDHLSDYNGDQMAQELNMQSKHSLEKAAAIYADVFTTVSDVTAREAEALLGKAPDVVTPNGFERSLVPSKKEYSAVRRAARERLFRVASALLGRDIPEDTFVIATSGRLEYRNKGLDMYLDAVSSLRGKENGVSTLALVLVPAWCAGPRQDLAEAASALVHPASPLNDPVPTHDINNPWEDPVLNRIHSLGFTAADDPSIIYVPCYLNGDDGIFNFTYYQFLPAVDLTVFASYYEPWGYTPHESVAFGIPTVTTTLSGFGAWALTHGIGIDNTGVQVIERTDSNYPAATAAVADTVQTVSKATAEARGKMRAAAQNLSAKADWKVFIRYYNKAYALALSKAAQRNK